MRNRKGGTRESAALGEAEWRVVGRLRVVEGLGDHDLRERAASAVFGEARAGHRGIRLGAQRLELGRLLRRGLKSLAENVIQGHLRHCVGESRTNAEAQRKLRDMLTVLERYVE